MPSPRSSLANLADWKALVDEADPFRFADRQKGLLKIVARANVEALTAMCKTGSERERYAAMSVLSEMSRRRDKRFDAVLQSQWLGLVRLEARAHFPESALGLLAFQIWRWIERPQAESFLLKELDYSGLDAHGLAAVAGHLEAFGSGEAISMLEGLKGLPPEAERDRRAFLDAVRPLTESRRRDLIREWKETRTNEALTRLFHALIRGWPEKPVRVKDLVAALGKPDRETSSGVGYSAKGEGLVIIADRKGFLEGYDFA